MLFRLGCACAKKVKELGGVAFAMTYYGECWMATDKAAYEAHLMNPADQSAQCIGHDYSSCGEGNGQCMGNGASEYAYSFPSAAPPSNAISLIFLCFYRVYFKKVFTL